MKDRKIFKRKFGTDEYGYVMMPYKMSGTKISRIIMENDYKYCSLCFPHGRETPNSHWINRQRCWKKYRKKQYYRG